MSSRPTVSVYSAEGASAVKQAPLPGVFTAPIRPDVINFVHTQMNKNRRQAYAVDAERAGMQTAAASWGTGRAVSRIPRVPGGGTHRAGQGAFGNMCRGGRMYNPTRVWRRWHRKISLGQKRYAVASAVAATGVTPLVMARGHRVSEVPELPLVLDNESLNQISKTKKAYELLESFGLSEDVDKAKESKTIRRGKGKLRNRRYTSRLGPMVVHGDRSAPLVKALRNLPGVDVCYVDDLNLLRLAPGGHMGRLVLWTEDAFSKLDRLFGESYGAKAELKQNYTLSRPHMTNADISRIINSDEVQKVARPMKAKPRHPMRKKNPLKNLGVMIKLNPYATSRIRAEIRQQEARKKAKADRVSAKRESATTRAQRREFMEKLYQ